MARCNGYAEFSADMVYRYTLGGDIGSDGPLLSLTAIAKYILWIMLNPSTANAQKDDQTIATIVRFSELWGYTRVMVANLYAYRATKPKDMWAVQKAGIDIVGPQNDMYIAKMVKLVRDSGGRVMVAWGKHGKPDRVRQVLEIAGEVYCLKTNEDGSPIHPLYQPSDLVPVVWTMPEAA